MNKFVGIVVLAVLLSPMQQGMLNGAPIHDQQMHELKKRQKQDRKELKQEQRATKSVMQRHVQTSQGRQRLKRNLKMQRQLLKNSQKTETRRLKGSHTPTNHPNSFHYASCTRPVD